MTDTSPGEPAGRRLWRDEFQGAPTGTTLQCKGWPQEALLRLLNNNLDPAVAERPEDLVVYGGTGKAARDWDCYAAIVRELRNLAGDETLLVQSGKPVGVFRTHPRAPRVLIANSLLVPHWATWDEFRRLEGMGLTMYGQMTAGSWCYIGSQGIVQGTYETFAELARQKYGGSLAGRWVLTAGLGGMGGAQPLAVTMNGGACLVIEVDEARLDRRVAIGYCDAKAKDLDEGVALVQRAAKERKALSVAVLGNAADTHHELLRRGVVPDVVTDQTSAHDDLNGYVPAGLPYEDALALRRSDPEDYRKRAGLSMGMHVEAMLEMQRRGAVAFDYGNNIRAQAMEKAGVKDAFDIGGFVPLFIRPQFCEGRGPFRWLALSGNEEDIRRTDAAVLKLFPEDKGLRRWIELAQARVPFQGLPARICWLGYGERVKAALEFNRMVRDGELSAPVAVSRDHLDCGSVASPFRETEGMRDGSDAIGDWPVLNALVNASAGADLVAVHHGGGVGIGYSLHAGMIVVLDGSSLAEEKARSVFVTDPGMGVVRHADAGYPEALKVARERGVRVPMRDAGQETRR